jgi:AcrR family transcriptional regulator
MKRPRSSDLPEPAASASKRDLLVNAAEELFRRNGVRGTTMEAIAAEAGVAKATAYASFRNKDDVFRAVCEHFAARLDARIAAASESKLTIEALLEAKYGLTYELVHSSPHAADLLATKDRVAASILAEADSRFREALRLALIETGMAAREAREVALLLENATYGLAARAESAAQLKSQMARLARALIS